MGDALHSMDSTPVYPHWRQFHEAVSTFTGERSTKSLPLLLRKGLRSPMADLYCIPSVEEVCMPLWDANFPGADPCGLIVPNISATHHPAEPKRIPRMSTSVASCILHNFVILSSSFLRNHRSARVLE